MKKVKNTFIVLLCLLFLSMAAFLAVNTSIVAHAEEGNFEESQEPGDEEETPLFTYVEGTLTWTSQFGNNLPLQKTKFTIMFLREGTIFNPHIELATGYTNQNGDFNVSINYDILESVEEENRKIFIRVYPESYTFKVAAVLNDYYIDSPGAIVEEGSTTTLNLNVDYNSGNDTNKAFYVAQGMVFAQRYAVEVGGMVANRFLSVLYPLPFSVERSAFCWNQYCGISADYFNSFDTVMHEYGHFVQGVMGTYGSSLWDIFLNNPQHSAQTDHLNDKPDKTFALHLTWSESWATTFAMMAQQHFLSELSWNANMQDRRAYSNFIDTNNNSQNQETVKDRRTP